MGKSRQLPLLKVLRVDATTRRRRYMRSLLTCAFLACSSVANLAFADPHYIANLTFFDRSPGSPRANSFEPVLRLDANDTSFAGAAQWQGGFNSWQKQFDQTKTLSAVRPDSGLVFIGDSVTQGWGPVGGRFVGGGGIGTWYSPQFDYGKYGALNFGFAGDQTQNVIYRVDHGQLDGLNPGLIVLMIGTNNRFAPTSNPGFPIQDYVGPPHTPEEIADGVLASVQAIHQKVPTADILTFSILRGLNNSDPDRVAVNAANALVEQAFNVDEDPKLHYLDMTDSFRNADGTINGNMQNDGIHLTAAGYAAWASAIEPYVTQHATLAGPSFFPNVAPRGTATWTNSVDGLFNHYAYEAIDGDLNTINHGDFDGSSGGNHATPDVLTVELDKSYDLKNVQIVNRGAVDGGSAVSDARLTGVVLDVLGANPADVLFTTVLHDDPNVLGETDTFDNGGQGFHGAKFIRLTSSGFLHVREIRANAAAVPEPAAISLLGALILCVRLPFCSITEFLRHTSTHRGQP